MSRTVGAVARLVGVTVRTLHHYDKIGLLPPAERSAAGYRRYGDADLDRLQRVLFYRELGFGLDEIRAVMNDGGTDPQVHLRRQHSMLLARIGRLTRMAAAVEKAMEAGTMGISLTPEERFEVFGGFNPDDHAAEVEERWGENEANRESMRRTQRYSKADWERIRAQGQAVMDGFVTAMRGGAADSVEAMNAAEAHRQQISDAFYPCSHEMQVGLAEMYLADPRFTATYERAAEGLARYVHDAIKANAARRAEHAV